MQALLFAFGAVLAFASGLPSMRDSLTHPVHVYEGDDALITCVVRNIEDNTVMWKKEDRERHSTRVLTAGDSRVTADKRFSVLHDSSTSGDEPSVPSGGDVWVLVVRNTKPADSGIYVCEVNSNPIVRSFHKLSVLSKALQPPANSNNSDGSFYESQKETFSSRNHNYTDCCISQGVSSNCLGFCNIQSILEGNTGQDPEHCESDFPAIVMCMADGRNHIPCCVQERVPDICQDVCRGEYTAITDNIKSHFSCSAYTEQTLACIVEGIELLPSPPETVEAEALSENSIRVSWSLPTANTETVTGFSINVTSLKTFDEHLIDPNEAHPTESTTKTSQTINLKVQANINETNITNLTPFTMYEITVTALNIHGSSLPSYAVRILTLTPGNVKQTQVGEAPELPDIQSCCLKKGITHSVCINKLCDPVQADEAEITDLMICAPWAADTFGCLTNGIDHTPCCRMRGLPPLCQQLCAGNITTIDFNYFKCLRYMSEYTNCLLEGYGVIPSSPTQVHVTNIDTEFAIIHWGPPKTLAETVKFYNIHYRMLTNYDSEYQVISRIHSPFILEGLESDTDYEFYVEAVNVHGISEPSTRIAFRTESKIIEEKIDEASTYNVTACCVDVQLNSVCLPLCSYDANMSDIKALAGVCGDEFHKILKCGAGGRNHGSCCSRRGVPNSCLPLCAGVIADNLLVTATTCIPFIGNIAQCFEEGTDLLPGPIKELHATVISDNSIELEWEGPNDGSNVTDYVIHYKKTDNASLHDTPLKLENQINSTETFATLSDLEKGALYQIFVVSRNQHGTSLPSSIILINVTYNDDKTVSAVTSPPHALAVSSHSATWVTISWQPPYFSHPTEKVSYIVYRRSSSDSNYTIYNTTVTSLMMNGLTPNTQYIVYVTAVTDKGQSLPSETLIAWTDPAYPAYVEPPTVHPINLVMEGSSMTILCIAMGTPMPTISLYISGRLVRQEITRHMVTVIHNVTRDMDQISCYADNGYGTPMQASKKITISHGPHIQASGITMAAIGDSVTLECKVDAYPKPKMVFWRNFDQREPVIHGGKNEIKTIAVKDEEDKYVMQLTIHNIANVDTGEYFCHAENAFGSVTQPVSVRIRNVAATHNVTQCCMEQNVSSTCMIACSFYLDIDSVIDKPECINDFDKLMKCAADGSDHRSCCTQMGVPRRCLDWCRGEPLLNSRMCVLSYTKTIMGCFHDGRSKLPGPPQHVRVEYLDAHSVKIAWDPPIKNPHTVEMYRVIWRLVDGDSKLTHKSDTSASEFIIGGLEDGATYECFIKAGNHKGTSTLTEPLRFKMGDKYITTAANQEGGVSHVGVAVGVVMALIVVGAIVVLTLWLMRNRKIFARKTPSGIAFENPSYLREVNMDHTQSNGENLVPNGTANGSLVSDISGDHGWKHEPLHVPSQTEVNPTLYEELKLGQNGAGFKRLKP